MLTNLAGETFGEDVQLSEFTVDAVDEVGASASAI